MSSSLRQRLARTVRALREEAGYSQEAFAGVIQVHRTYMGKLERGETDPGLEVLVRVARGLGRSLSELLRHAEGEPGGDPNPSGAGTGDWNPPKRPRLVAEGRKPPKKKK